MKHSKLLIAILVLPLIYSLTGCYPNKIDYVDEYDVAITPTANFVEDTDFSQYTTFSIIDTIVHVYGEDEEDDPNLSRDSDEFILAQLSINMEEMGYIEIENPDSITNRPDLLLAVSATSAEYYYYYSYYPYYWGWYGWGWYGMGYSTSYYYGGYPWWGYPGWGYPYYGGYSSYKLSICGIRMLLSSQLRIERE